MDSAIDAVVEIFSWVGFGLGALLALSALIMHLADGTWLPARGVVDETEHGLIVRWFDEDGGVCQAHLSHEQEHSIAGKDMIDIFYRRGGHAKMRLTRGSPAVRAVALLAAGLVGVGALALIVSGVLLFARG